MHILCSIHLGETIITGILCGVLASLIVLGIQYAVKKCRMRRLYIKPFHGKSYKAHFKNDETKKTQYTVKLKVRDNIIDFSGLMKDGKFPIVGKITMDIGIKDYGRGFYHHIDPTSQGFGFSEVQDDRAKNQFYIHQIYFHTPNGGESIARHHAFVWEVT